MKKKVEEAIELDREESRKIKAEETRARSEGEQSNEITTTEKKNAMSRA